MRKQGCKIAKCATLDCNMRHFRLQYAVDCSLKWRISEAEMRHFALKKLWFAVQKA